MRCEREFRIGGTAAEIESFAETLGPENAVALEATFHSWSIHRILKRHAGRVVVGNPLATKAIAHARIKTVRASPGGIGRGCGPSRCRRRSDC